VFSLRPLGLIALLLVVFLRFAGRSENSGRSGSQPVGQSTAGGDEAADFGDTDLLTVRKQCNPRLYDAPPRVPDPPARPPAASGLELVRYRSPAGLLKAYLTADPKDGRRRPGVLWAHGGFGGIGSNFWERPDPRNDQTAAAFRDAGFVCMFPSWRGENDNPGRLELFYGEVDDLLAARDALARQTYVDPDRIYIAGHSTGGTLTLLAAVSTDKFRAAFSFGGCANLTPVVEDGRGYGNTPFDHRVPWEAGLRSAVHFVKAIKRPTFYFEGCRDGYENGYCPDADRMAEKAKAAGVPFRAFALPWGDHFTILHKVTRLVAAKIQADTDAECRIAFTKDELGAR
jgi:dienelactone hydrolase